jgi:hypothetical protein
VQGFMPTLAWPEVDVLDGLTTATSVSFDGVQTTTAPPPGATLPLLHDDVPTTTAGIPAGGTPPLPAGP